MANTYLTRTLATPTNNKKYTYSLWVKRGIVTNQEILLSAGTSNSDGDFLVFRGNDKIEWQMYHSGNVGILLTNRLFRDCSSWYHIQIAYDSANATAGDRMKMYINGVEETSFATDTQPSQNLVSRINSAVQHNIGNDTYGLAAGYFTGSLSHIHFVDGQAYAPTVFGETDATTGEWKGKTSPSVTYGNNGFFILKDGNGITDQSGEGNNFTVSGGTLTDLKDNPDNTFATWNALVPLTTNYVYLNGNTSVNQTSGSWKKTVSTIGVNSGKWYWEVSATNAQISAGKYTVIGVATTTDATAPSGMPPSGIGMKNNGTVAISTSTVATLSGFELGDIISCYLDMDNGALYYAKNGVMENSGVPTSGASKTGAFSLPNPTETHFASLSPYGTNNKAEANFGNGYFGTTAVTTNSGNGYSGAEGSSKFNYTVPTGYSALSTKGLNE